MDFYAASGMSLLWCTFFQTVAICWIFGGKKIYDCIEQMIGFRINWYWYICWMCTAPAFMIVSKLPINKNDFHIDLELNLIFWMLLNNKKNFFYSFYSYSTSQNILQLLTQKHTNIRGGEKLSDSVLVVHQ